MKDERGLAKMGHVRGNAEDKKQKERDMKGQANWLAVAALAAAGMCLAGCRSGYEPVAARPIAVQPVAVQPAPVVPVAETAGPVATSVASVEVRTSPAAVPQGPRTKAVLVVQNHTGASETPFALSTLGDWLQTALGAGSFAVVNPHDAIGTEQNTGSGGEKMPESSAVRLAENLDAPVLLTASVTSARVREIGGTDPGVQAVLEFTLSAKAVPGGEGVASVTAAARSKKESSPLAFDRKAENTWAEVAKEAAFSAAKALQAEYAKAGAVPPPGAEKVRVAFSANVPGANVRIDGVSYGTAGPEARAFSVSKGLHNLEVAYPGLVGFKDLVKIQEETSFDIHLALTAEGEVARRKDALFAATLDRLEKSGATDDLVRELVARGYANLLTTSYTRIEGMPRSLTLRNSSLPSLGLPSGEMNIPAGPSTEKIEDRLEKLVE